MYRTETMDSVVTMQKQRFEYIDQLKGIAIFFVVVGHFIQFNIHNYLNNPFYSFIYSFHMPLFMFLSGYIAQKTTKPAIFQSYFTFFRKKAITLLIPFFAWPLLILPFLFGNRIESNPLHQLTGLVEHPDSGLWYLWFLFFLYILYSLFLLMTTRFAQKNNILIDVTAFILVGAVAAVAGYFLKADYLHSFLLYYLFFFMGVFISKYPVVRTFLLNNVVFSVALVAFIVLGKLYNMNDEGQLNKVIKIVAATSAIASLYYIANTIVWNLFVNKMVTNWGKHSLIIYVTQMPILYFFTMPDYVVADHPLIFIFICLACSLVIVLICLGISKIIELSRWLDLLFYGRLK